MPDLDVEPGTGLTLFNYDTQHAYFNATGQFKKKPFLRRGRRNFMEKNKKNKRYQHIQRLAAAKKALINIPMAFKILRHTPLDRLLSAAGERAIYRKQRVVAHLRKVIARFGIRERAINYT